MKRKLSALVVAITCISLSACGPGQAFGPTSTNTPTYTPTDTPTPTFAAKPQPTPTNTPIPITGKLFFDMNGSGLQDKVSFIYYPARLTDGRETLQPDLLKVINAYITAHPDKQAGDMITIDEPGLSGYKVCSADKCASTDEQGDFIISGATSPLISITDPNAGTPMLEMMYINEWNGAVTVPEYTKDVDAATMAKLASIHECVADAAAQVCKQDADTLLVREQHLNDTSVEPIQNQTLAKPGYRNEIGLMQGYVVMPLSSSDFSKLDMIQGFDQDPSPKIFDYTGSTLTCSEYNICQRMNRVPGIFLNATGNDHTGIDFGYYGSPSKYDMLISAGMGGYIQERPTDGGILKNNIDILSFIGQKFGGSSKPIMNNGHVLLYLIEDGIYVYPGQIIAVMGNTGTATDWTHLHFEIQYGTPINNNWIGYSKDFFRQINADLIVPNFNDKSVWTVDNLPIFIR